MQSNYQEQAARNVLSLRLTPEERARAGKAAQLEGFRRGQLVTLSDYIREVLASAVELTLAQQIEGSNQ